MLQKLYRSISWLELAQQPIHKQWVAGAGEVRAKWAFFVRSLYKSVQSFAFAHTVVPEFAHKLETSAELLSQQQITMALDQKILELRLLIKESSVNQASLSRCASKLQTFGKNVNDNAALEGLLKEFLLNQLEYEKTKNSFQALDGQNEEYAKLERAIQDRVSEAIDNITKLEEELRQQQVVRAHRVECEQRASEVNKHPSRSNLKRKIDTVTQTLDSTKASIELVETEIEQKKYLVVNIVQAIAEVQKYGKVVAEEENKAAEVDEAEGADETDDRDNDRGNRTSKAERDSGAEEEEAGNGEVELDEDGNPIGEVEGEENEGEEEAQDSAAMEE